MISDHLLKAGHEIAKLSHLSKWHLNQILLKKNFYEIHKYLTTVTTVVKYAPKNVYISINKCLISINWLCYLQVT